MDSIVLAVQVLIFGVVVLARLHMTSHLARKRIIGFSLSILAGFMYMGLMVHKELFVLAAMEIIIIALDSRGVVNNRRKEDLNDQGNPQ